MSISIQAPNRKINSNTGSSLPATNALHLPGWSTLPINDWKNRESIDSSNHIRLARLTFVHYVHKSLVAATAFLLDFGMTIAKQTPDKIWFRGYSNDPYCYIAEEGKEMKFLGGGYTVESYADLERAATQIPGASGIEQLTEYPGGGFRVRIIDPEGFPTTLIYGVSPIPAPSELPAPLLYNSETRKIRNGAFQRFQDGPAAVHKLGHYGLCVTDLQAQLQFYTRYFNIVPSDFMYVPSPDAPNGQKEVSCFMHIDCGSEFVDHHSFFLSTSPTRRVHHSSFEVHDFDTQLLGHKWLASKNYNSVWGVGRHVLGSQIFDYWYDPTGFIIEHYADGDTVNDETPIGYGEACAENLAVWGPELPKDFLA